MKAEKTFCFSPKPAIRALELLVAEKNVTKELIVLYKRNIPY